MKLARFILTLIFVSQTSTGATSVYRVSSPRPGACTAVLTTSRVDARLSGHWYLTSNRSEAQMAVYWSPLETGADRSVFFTTSSAEVTCP